MGRIYIKVGILGSYYNVEHLGYYRKSAGAAAADNGDARSVSALCGNSTHDLAVARKRGNTVLEASAAAIEEADKRCILVAAAIDKCNYLFGGDCGDRSSLSSPSCANAYTSVSATAP